MKKDKKQAASIKVANKSKTGGNAKGKVSFDENGQGAAPKYGQAGDSPNESGETMKNMEKVIDKS